MAAFSLPSLSSLFTWRNAAILFALLNLKNLPFVWHLRLLRHLIWNMNQVPQVQRKVKLYTGSTHPIFEPVSMYSRSPLLETDYNLHKSNSTFFTDLDVSRTALATKLLQPGMRAGSERLEQEGKTGSPNVILGSVHCSYHKEIKPYEKYEIRSRILGWDKKWLLIGSWFIRPGRAPDGKDEQVLASALSKYVIKKGRFTVPPERALQSSGWLPETPMLARSPQQQGSLDVTLSDSTVLVDDAEIPRRRDLTSPMRQESINSGSGIIVAPIPEKPLKQATTIQHLEDAALKGSDSPSQLRNRAESNSPPKWDWYRIDLERQRGLELAKGWLSLDNALMMEGSRRPGAY
jgi:Thioesterase-like superfamily